MDNKEVDFLVTINGTPWFAAEVKLSDTTPSPNIEYFRERLKIPFVYQIIRKSGIDISGNGVRIISADKFFTA